MKKKEWIKLILAESFKDEQKLINYALQNFLVEGETLHYEYKTPFNFFALGLNRNKILPEMDFLTRRR